MQKKPYAFSHIISYKLDLFLSRGAAARFAAIFVLSVTVTFVCALIHWTVHSIFDAQSPAITESLKWGLNSVLDSTSFAHQANSIDTFVAIASSLSGIMVVATLFGIVGTVVTAKLESMRLGKSEVIDENHTLILGYGQKLFTIIDQICIANANHSDLSIVVLSTAPKQEVEEAIRANIPKDRIGTTRVVVRQGTPHNPTDLRKVAAGRARAIIMLSPDAAENTYNPLADQEADMNAIKVLLALKQIPGALKDNFVVMDILDGDRIPVFESIGGNGLEAVAMRETLARLLVQTARQTGLAQVYHDLMTFDGSEFYIKHFAGLEGKTFDESQDFLKECIAIGIRRASIPGRQAILVNPPGTTKFERGDEVIVLAEDDDSFSLSATAKKHATGRRSAAKKSAATPKRPEKVLICGYRTDIKAIIHEFDQYAAPGSSIDLALFPHTDAYADLKQQLGKLKSLTIRSLPDDPTHPDAAKHLSETPYTAIMLLADNTVPAQEADARTVISLLLLRQAFAGRPTFNRPRVISEILDPRTKNLVSSDDATEFVISSEMISMLLAQIAERRELNYVFAELFDSDGDEVYLKRVSNYAPLNQETAWGEVMRSARQRAEIAIGYVEGGTTPVLNPPVDQKIRLTTDFRIIVIAKDDNEAIDTYSSEKAAA